MRTRTPPQFAIRAAADLDNTVLPIQGPPGAGKTYNGAKMICELARNGARVGVTAVSHKVIGNLLDGVVKAADELEVRVTCAQKVRTPGEAPPNVDEITTNDEAIDRLADGRASVVGATLWLWADAKALNAVDVLFVDEAGQMSLANVLAASQAARSVVLPPAEFMREQLGMILGGQSLPRTALPRISSAAAYPISTPARTGGTKNKAVGDYNR